ncbi:CHAD domain-containing protein [Armatimonas rosea]|uniref:CHAD domain-containing protein n=1 Tax=Armatimonas rosea TaxID=685828 RepID=A0A7W9W546_ARMRO|nr:CHAD domain-containing protein [Armatimonas rosea]MBB6048691.1 CHAD domain-containing protein [Armatimonas rosea]
MEPITTLIERLTAALPLALKGDPVALKKARTTGRRLRVVLPLSTAALPKKLRLRLLDNTKTLTRALGSVRDLDAQQELLTQAALTATEPERVGLAFAGKVLQKRRRQALKRVCRRDAARDWLKCAEQVQGVPALAPDSEPAATHAEVHTAAQLVLAFDTPIRDPKNIAELHDLRIAVKRLRFTVSRVPETQKALKTTVAELQTILGTVHDLDILRLWLRSLLQEKKRRLRPSRSQRTSLTALRQRFQTERGAAYLAFREQWEAALPTLQGL